MEGGHCVIVLGGHALCPPLQNGNQLSNSQTCLEGGVTLNSSSLGIGVVLCRISVNGDKMGIHMQVKIHLDAR